MNNRTEAAIAATKRALAENPDQSAFWIDSSRCRVYGRTGNEYTVRVIGDPTRDAGYSCDCPAGEHAYICWHVAAAMLRRTPAISACRPVPAKVEPKPSRPVCHCGASLSPSGRCDSVTLFGSHNGDDK